MAELPETSDSLLRRVQDPRDDAAWERFVTAYRPVVYRLARRRGLQDADAEDLAQHVLASVSRAIVQWEKDAQRGSFRSWLLCITRNAIVNALTRGPIDVARGGTSVAEKLQRSPDEVNDIESLIEEEHQRMLFRWAAAEVELEFQEDTWRAFRMTTVDGLSVEQAARELGKSVGAIYAARSRVMRRLREFVRKFDTA